MSHSGTESFSSSTFWVRGGAQIEYIMPGAGITFVCGQNDQLFVSWARAYKGKLLSRQRLSHWLVEVIVLGYRCKGLQPSAGLQAHSTRSKATSWALLRGIRVEDICVAASWASLHTFARSRLEVTGLSQAAVLELGASGTA